MYYSCNKWVPHSAKSQQVYQLQVHAAKTWYNVIGMDTITALERDHWFFKTYLVSLQQSSLVWNNDNDNDNDNILFDHNVQIQITIFNSLENQIIDWSGDYY